MFLVLSLKYISIIWLSIKRGSLVKENKVDYFIIDSYDFFYFWTYLISYKKNIACSSFLVQENGFWSFYGQLRVEVRTAFRVF